MLRKVLGTKKGEIDKNSNKLPKHMLISHYTICFKPFIDELSFEACVAVDMTLSENSKQIFLHGADMVVTKMMWEEDVTLNRQEPIEMSFTDREQLQLTFDPFLSPQDGQLRINFRGRVNDRKMTGLFRYRTKNRVTGEVEYILASHFSPTDARRCFPCSDDPSVKAKYDICLIVDKGLTAVGNMPIKVTYPHKRNSAMEIVEFKKSPPMSANSVAFVIGNFQSVEKMSLDGEAIIRVHSPVGRRSAGAYAMEVGCVVLPFLAKYLSFPLSLQKIDMISVPDYPHRACEHLGLIIFQESQLLLDEEDKVDSRDKMLVAQNVSEFIVKQWLGCIVGLKWWNHLWFKEGVSNFLRYFCVQEIYPDLTASLYFITEIGLEALRLDGFKASHPAELAVTTPLEIEEYAITARFKGAAIIRMLENYIGTETFRDALKLLLTNFQFSAASTEDLWIAFEEVCSKPIKSFMNVWTQQRGYPILRVIGKQDGRNRFLKITQDRFTTDPYSKDARNDPTWVIPINITSADSPTSVILHTIMDAKTTTLVVPNVDRNDWIKLNPGMADFYRVRYTPDMLSLLSNGVRTRRMEPADRINLLDDQFALLLCGTGSTIELLTFMEAYLEDDDYHVWNLIGHIIDRLMKVFASINMEESAKHFGRFLFSKIYERVGHLSTTDSHHQSMLRTIVLRMMVRVHHPDVINRCKLMNEAEIRKEKAVDPNDRLIVYCALVATADEDGIKTILRKYRETDSVQEKDRIIRALGFTSEHSAIKMILDFILTDDVRKSNAVKIMIAVCENIVGREYVWNFFKENLTYFKNQYSATHLSRLIKGMLEDFATDEKVLEVTEFFKANSVPGTDRAVQMAIESIKTNDSWIKREKNLSSLQDYMEADAV